MRFLITTSPGLEEENAKEIFELTGIRPELSPSGVLEINAEMKHVYRVLCGSFLSSRVLMPLADFHAWEKDVLYLEAKKIPWETLIGKDTFVCDVHGRTENCDYSAAQGLLKVKDAIVDRIREKTGERPDVDKENPAHQVELLFWKGKAEISIDLSGEPLHRRNYRKLHGAAPLRESRAAALLRQTGILEKVPTTIYDPFCGAGTIAIEAALMLRKIPAANRRYVPKKKFIDNFHADYLRTLEEMRAGALPRSPARIIASDLDGAIVPRARKAADMAGVLADIQFEVKSYEHQTFKAGEGYTVLVSNPPYGERLEEVDEAKRILQQFGRKIKFESDVERMTLLVPRGMEALTGLKPARKTAWKAATLDLVAATYELWKGAKVPRPAE